MLVFHPLRVEPQVNAVLVGAHVAVVSRRVLNHVLGTLVVNALAAVRTMRHERCRAHVGWHAIHLGRKLGGMANKRNVNLVVLLEAYGT